jgi:hypothetical protein
MYAYPEPLICVRRHSDTQWFYPSGEGNAGRLARVLTLLTDTFENWPGLPPAGFRESVVAYHQAKAFVWECAVGNDGSAADCLARARALDADVLSTARFAQQIADVAAVLDEADAGRYARAVAFLASLDARLRGICDPGVLQTTVAEAYHTLAYMACQRDKPGLAARLYAETLGRDPQHSGKRGMVSHLLQASWRCLLGRARGNPVARRSIGAQ